MSEQLDTYLMSVGMALARQEFDVDRAIQLLSAPEIIDRVDGSNVQQLIRLALMTSRMGTGSESYMIAEVGVLLSMIKPDLEVDFGIHVGVSNAQSCALFAMHCVVYQQGNLAISLAILEKMTPSLVAASDRKGLLEVLCWLGILHGSAGDHAKAVGAFSAALLLLDEPEMINDLQDNSALDMVRADNMNVFSFPALKIFQSTQSSDIAVTIRELRDAALSKMGS